jgi:hypothetical protein
LPASSFHRHRLLRRRQAVVVAEAGAAVLHRPQALAVAVPVVVVPLQAEGKRPQAAVLLVVAPEAVVAVHEVAVVVPLLPLLRQ